MTTAAYVREIVDTWMIVANEERELTDEEMNHILNLQKLAIEEIKNDDGLDDEELKAEYLSNFLSKKDVN